MKGQKDNPFHYLNEQPADALSQLVGTFGLNDEKSKRLILSVSVRPERAARITSFARLNQRKIVKAKARGIPFPVVDANAVDGDLRFAKTEEGCPVGISLDEPHTIITGQSKSGKTVCQELIILNGLKKGHKAWMYVRSNDVTRIIRKFNDVAYFRFPGKLKLNPLRMLTKEVFITIFNDAYTLFEGSESYLLEAIAELQARNPYANLIDLRYFIEKRHHPMNSREQHFKESILNRLKGLLSSAMGSVFDCASGHEADICNTSAIFNLSKLTVSAQKFLMNSTITFLYEQGSLSDDKPIHMVSMDDDAIILVLNRLRELGVIDDILCTGRKGFAHLLICTQIPSILSPGIMSNMSNKIAFRNASGVDVQALQDHMGITDKDQKGYFYKLNQQEHEAITEFTLRARPFAAKVIHTKLQKKMSLDELDTNNDRILGNFSRLIERNEIDFSNAEQKQEEESLAEGMNLLGCYYYQFDACLTDGYRTLGWGGEKGDSVINRMERMGFVKFVKLNPSGKQGGTSVYVFHTDKYYAVSKKEKPIPGTDGKGPEHCLMLRFLLKNIKEVKKCSPELGKPFEGARSDIYFTYADASYLVEACSSTLKTESEKITKILKNHDIKLVFVVANKIEMVAALKKEFKAHEYRNKIIPCKLSEFLNKDMEQLTHNKEA